MPLQIPDQTIAAQVPEGPDVTTRISSLLDIQRKRQQITAGDINNTSNQANLDEDQRVRSLMQNFDSYKGADGNVDMNKFVPDVLSAAPTKGAGIISGVVNAQRDGTNAKKALAELSQTQKAQIAQEVGSYANNGKTPQENEDRFNAFTETMPNAKPIADYFHKYVMPSAGADPETAKDAYLRAATTVMSPSEQIGTATPKGIAVTDNRTSQTINTAPLAQPIGTAISGTLQKEDLPVPTKIIGPDGKTEGYDTTDHGSTLASGQTAQGSQPQPPNGPPAAGYGTAGMSRKPGGMQIPASAQNSMKAQQLFQMKDELANTTDPQAIAALKRSISLIEMSMPQGQQQPQQVAQNSVPSQRGFVASGLGPGVTKGIEGTQEVINKDYSASSDRAGQAGKDISILNNIKQYAPDAITGYGGDTRKVLAGMRSYIASKLNMDTTDFAKSKTDELSKNTNMLALAGGNTNLAKQLSEVANPNTTMDTPAIISTANQLISARKLDIAEFKFKDQFKSASSGHPELYTEGMKAFNEVNDPKVMEWGTMSSKEQSAFKGSMSAADQKSFGDKLTKARQLGIAPMAGSK